MAIKAVEGERRLIGSSCCEHDALCALRRALGSNAIFVMLVPYCMIHFGKPMAETLGAVCAGLILGTTAMRTRWGGLLIHLGVAVSMDLLALHGCPPIGSGRPCGGE